MNKLLRFLSNLFAKWHISLANKAEEGLLGGAGYKVSFTAEVCGCEIGFDSWDDNLQFPSEPWDFVRHCSVHTGADKSTLFAKIKAESGLKNYTEAELQNALPSLTTINSNGAIEWKSGIEYQWSFDVDRKLSVSVTNVTNKTSLQKVLDDKFGKDQVTII